MFLEQHERLLLFHNRVPSFDLAVESLKGIRKAGIETAFLGPCWASWHEIEPKPGVYDWSVTDEIIARHRETGLKMILSLYMLAPNWLEGCHNVARTEGTTDIPPTFNFPGTSYRTVDPFNEDNMAREAEFLHRVCKRYSSPDILCCYAMPHGGERLLPSYLGKTYTEQNCIDIVLARQNIFAEYGDELWTTFHPDFATAKRGWIDSCTHPNLGNEHLWACYDAMREKFPRHTLNQFISIFFGPGGPPDRYKNEDVKTWVGAEYVSGVVGNARKIPTYNLWGMLMGAQHRYAPNVKQPGLGEYAEVEKAVEILGGMK